MDTDLLHRLSLPLVLAELRPDEPVIADTAVAGALSGQGVDVVGTVVPDPGDGDGPAVGAVVLLDGQVAALGERGPTLVDHAVRAIRPGGLLAVAVPAAVRARLAGDDGPAMTSAALQHLLAERGLDVHLLAAPGAAAHVAGRDWAGREDLELDRTPGLLDAGEVLVAVGRTPRSEAERSATFFSSIARKLLATAAVCRDDDGRILLVFDLWKNAWTLPGGIIDADEHPRDAVEREVWEEGGVRVTAGAVLGVFAHSWPDRVQIVYAATPDHPTPDPEPVHTHEVSQCRWVHRDELPGLVDSDVQRRISACLDHPGETWRW